MQDDNKYLEKLIYQLFLYKEQNKTLRCEIIRSNRLGFRIKAAGLFGFLPFNLMPWTYKNLSHWHTLAPSLVGCVFYVKIAEIRMEPFQFIVNGREHLPFNLKFNELSYQARVIEIYKYGLLIELGEFFDWKFGSMVSLLHNSKITESADYYVIGDVIEVFFNGYNKENKLMFTTKNEGINWDKLKIKYPPDYLVLVTKKIEEDSKYSYNIEGSIPCLPKITKIQNPLNKSTIKELIKNLPDGGRFWGKVIEVDTNHQVIKVSFANPF